jgi:hypothetical protein
MTIPRANKTPDARLRRILDAALAAKAPNREGCRYLLGFEAHSIEAGVLRATANALYPEAGEPQEVPSDAAGQQEGFSSALWRRSQEITTADCRNMLAETGFS